MNIRYWVYGVISVSYWACVVWAVCFYLSITHDISALNISAALLPRLSHPVFAQFTATQTLLFNTPIMAVRLEIPLYLPEHASPILIRLYQDKKLVTWWKYAPSSPGSGVVMAELPFVVPTTLSGNIDVALDGSSILYADRDSAPAFFAETQDGAYPNGNYRIANNEKSGDIAMNIVARKTNQQLFFEHVQRQPLGEISALLIYGCGALLIVYIPIMSIRLIEESRSKNRT